ncbi:glutathione S-transferase-like [Diabrotica virgifera virgifera]|uniref:glutathione transferase n=1 Tax=Diabrotica virgifera virgifera TaxID=50390 RepID=A0ABM5KHX7_DIAVI|nr:glutathione S-transferase-like [Diabrotica virgifera virgifera]
MAHTYKLIYFDVPGKGEAIRMILSYGEIPFEDKRIQMGDWPKLKPTTPLGQLPLLEVDGKAIPQSTAICRYLASIVKLDGKDAKENLALDVALETLFDLQKMNGEIKYEQDAAKKKEKLEKLLQQGLPLYFGKLDEYAKKHNGYIAFERLSWADILFVCVYEALVNLAGKEAVASYPSLQQVKKNVLATKGINKWIKNRPAVEGYDLKQDL